MKRSLTNAVSGVIDYVSYPLGMLLVAPVILHRLGASEYGLWMIATAVVSAGSIIASGFCDANIQRIAQYRAAGDSDSLVGTVRIMLAIDLLLGAALALAVWIAAPYASRHIGVAHSTPIAECLVSIRIAAVLILVRSLESVAVSTQRAFERYRNTVQISTAMRLLTLGSVAVLAIVGLRIGSILVATGVFLVLGTGLQFREVVRLLGTSSLWPHLQFQQMRSLASFGIFVWLEAVGGLVFGQFDRILLGFMLGAAAVAPYALCVQFAHPLFGLTASAIHFLFPYLSSRTGVLSNAALRRTLFKAFACNLVLVACGACALLLLGDHFLRIWAGPAVAAQASAILPLIVLSSALAGLSVTGTYAMQAFGLFRAVALLSLGGKAVVLVLMFYLLRRIGLEGLAIARVCYGAFALLVYLPLWRKLAETTTEVRTALSAAGGAIELQEGSQL